MLTVGIDLLEISRIERAMKNPRFCRRILGEQEYEQLAARGFPAESVAASFCAKEAFSKAMGTGVRGFLLGQVQLLRDNLGRPYLLLSGAAENAAHQRGLTFSVSATHTAQYAAVTVIGEEHKNESAGKRRSEGAGGRGGKGGNRVPRADGKRRTGRRTASARTRARRTDCSSVRKGE